MSISPPSLLLIISLAQSVVGVTLIHTHARKKFECGEFGFKCYGFNKLKLCADDSTYGPTFLCPASTFCNEGSSEVCQTSFTYIDPETTKSALTRCRRYERIADTSVPNCKGYILCIPNKNQFQGVKFKCTGNTVFNGLSRSCSSPLKYKCPAKDNETFPTLAEDAQQSREKFETQIVPAIRSEYITRPIDCKNYRFSVPNESSASSGKAAFFCPPRPLPGESYARCTVFSNQFCITLQKEGEEDQFSLPATRRRPRILNYYS